MGGGRKRDRGAIPIVLGGQGRKGEWPRERLALAEKEKTLEGKCEDD